MSELPLEFGNCPKCQASLDGTGIWQTFFDKTGDEAEADRIAAMYGASRTKGRWGRAVGLYSINKDVAEAYQCPECKHEWRRR